MKRRSGGKPANAPAGPTQRNARQGFSIEKRERRRDRTAVAQEPLVSGVTESSFPRWKKEGNSWVWPDSPWRIEEVADHRFTLSQDGHPTQTFGFVVEAMLHVEELRDRVLRF
jgi:hypothetical protein